MAVQGWPGGDGDDEHVSADGSLAAMPFSFLLKRLLREEQKMRLVENVRRYNLKAKLKAVARTVRERERERKRKKE